MQPLQVTSKPRCTARVPNKWWHNREFGVAEDHQCPFPIWRDGRCKRHHAANIVPMLERRESSLAERLEKTRAELAQVRTKHNFVPANIENPS